ncbi:MAG: hypothetical protein HOW73_09825 [Polyangiaceae bacterium]|nr:hypothetical protein [Polyangiaceae bacterium]
MATHIAILGVAAMAAPSCGDPEGECDIDEGSGCGNGQECLLGADGESHCFCSVDGDTGCEGGQQCLEGPDGDPACYCNTETEGGCEPGLVCEEVVGGYPDCFPPVTLGGMVFDLATDEAIEGALVVARDANFAAVSGVAATDAAGHYELTVPVPRNADGSLAEYDVFLRADAQGYLNFPAPPRVALPIDMSQASGDPLLLESSATDIGLIELENTDGLGIISGTVVADVPIGTLVVAGGATEAGGGVTGIADTDGSYTIFNVPAGTVGVRGYKAGLQLGSATADVVADAVTEGVDLVATGEATAVIGGKVEIVNPGNGSDTSIILVVDETFNPTAARGEAPPGLRVSGVSGDFQIPFVPDGNYVVLAAFENDFLVRDPDVSIGGTGLVRITVEGSSMTIDESFKITGSLDEPKPDNEEVVSGTPTFSWADDSGEDHYEVRLYDAYGTLVWEKLDVPGVSGDKYVEVTYEGDPLVSGLLYQFRAVSIKNGGSPISITEDLKGVFLYQ